MTIADTITVFDQFTPFAGAFMISLWLLRDFVRAQHEIDEFVARLKAIEAQLAADDTGVEVAELYGEKEPDSLPLPRPLPTATARYR